MAGQTFDILVVGGGTGGITVASHLVKTHAFSTIAIIEPSAVHYYQPLWTLVGGGAASKESTRKQTQDFIPPGTTWIQESALEFLPENNQVKLASGELVGYRFLVVAPGMEIFWDRIKGLKESLGTNGVCSNYSYETVEGTWKAIQAFKKGRAVFTFPNTPIKCGGAPQKIMYLAEDYFRKNGIRDQAEVVFASAGASIFAVKKYADALNRVIQKRGIQTQYRQCLVEVRAKEKIAVFEHMDTKEKTEMSFDLLHVTPPMGAPGFIRKSPLANADGWIDIDKHTLQHKKYSNIFALGDASSLPTSKTGAAIRKQAPVLIENLISLSQGKELLAKYNGYTSCPLVTGYGKLILAEFDYDGNPQETFPFDQSKERLSMYWLKKYLLPFLYWKGMLKGRA